MSINISSPTTGAAETGFTAPTYTFAVDTAPSLSSKQWAVTAIGGTQAGVHLHSPALPATVTVFKPAVLKTFPTGASSSSTITRVGKNQYRVLTRWGVNPAANQPAQIMSVETLVNVPAGAEVFDAPNVLAAQSCHIGVLSQISAGLGDTTKTGIF